MRFEYKKIPLKIKPEPVHVFRPVIPIEVEVSGKSLRYEVLIDSGADFCLFHGEIAELLGLSLNEGKEHVFGGIGRAGLKGYEHSIRIKLGGHTISTDVIFSNEISNSGYGILGQLGFFEFFRIRFIYSKRQIEITRER